MDIYYEIYGEGFPIVLLHGNGEDHHIFDQLIELLKTRYQVIAIDSRYHGKSIHQGKLSYEQMCDDVKRVMTDLEIEAYDVIGFSDGGIVSLLLGMNDSRLQHIVCMGANTKPQNIKWFYRITMYLQMLCLLPFCLYHKKARLTLQLTSLMIKEPQIQYDELSKVKIPVLILAGEHDMIKESDTLKMGESLPYSVVKIIKQGNHFLLRDSFQKTSHEIMCFLEACHMEE